MAVFRVERTKDYTVMSNHHLKDTSLSLKAKGLLSIMLSLPETWNYTTRGLAAICKEGVDAISSAIRELETSGSPEPGGPDTPFPCLENPYVVGPDAAAPGAEKPAQLNINQVSTNQSKTNPSRLTEGNARAGAPSGAGCVETGTFDDAGQAVRLARERIRAQIEYGCICTVENREQVDEFVEIMLEVSLTESPAIRIGRGREYPTAFVRERFAQIDSSHIERLLDAILENKTQVRNTKAYLLAALFDAPATKENHYTMRANSG